MNKFKMMNVVQSFDYGSDGIQMIYTMLQLTDALSNTEKLSFKSDETLPKQSLDVITKLLNKRLTGDTHVNWFDLNVDINGHLSYLYAERGIQAEFILYEKGFNHSIKVEDRSTQIL